MKVSVNDLVVFLIGFIMFCIVSTLDYNVMMLCK